MAPRSVPTSRRSSRRARPTRAADPASIGRFAADLDALIAPGRRLGLAVSGGPDSLALLLLAAAARPGQVEAASVDHRLRDGSGAEPAMVAELCLDLGVPHETLRVDWGSKPSTAIQERARERRYALLSRWLDDRGLEALATAHHLDDQAETLVMRLNRGAGVRGLAGMRPQAPVPGSSHVLLRPLLGWRRSELESVCAEAGIQPAADPANADERFERVRVRRALAEGWLDPQATARSAAHLASADSALDWASGLEWDGQVSRTADGLVYRPSAPAEIRRRVIERAIRELATEGESNPLRGREIDALLESLSAGGSSTLRGVLCVGGLSWRFAAAPTRRR